MDSQLVVFSFATQDDAERAAADLRGLDAQGFLTLEDGAILTKAADGTVAVKPLALTDVAKGTGIGSVLGLVVGGVIGLPVLGLLAGAGAGASRSIDSDGMDELMATVGHAMDNDSAVVAVQVAAVDDPDVVRDRLAVDSITSVDIPAELREHIEAQREQRRS